MSTRNLSIGIFLLCCTLLIGQIGELKAAEEFVVTGKDWVASTSDVKGAFLVGAGTIIDVEHEYQGNNPPSNDQSSIPTLAKGLNGLTLRDIQNHIDRYYRDNSTKLDRQVILVIWDLAVSRLKSR